MSIYASHTHLTECPVCGSHKVLVVAKTATVASLYCLSCEHLFAAEVEPAQPDPDTDDQPITPPPTARAASTPRCSPGS